MIKFPVSVFVVLALLGKVSPNAHAQIRPLGTWLDDADTLKPRTASIGIQAARYLSPSGRETDVPSFDVSVGVAGGVQVGASLPYYRATYSGGFTASGLGDTYLISKIRLVNGDKGVLGVSLSPMLEILSKAEVSNPAFGLRRVNWALPASVQAEGDRTRAYATVAYFSRGAVSAAGAVEQTLSSRVTVSGELLYSHSTRTIANIDEAQNPSRTDAEGSIYVTASPVVTFSASAGRTISKTDQNASSLIASFGISFTIATRARR